mmetsp:Transcript_95304/g.254903  ORF Transcript_95304/g.254903 Transcript_95304/m.254903 type:complete len:92 (+) Transcript_95304:1120-1395(+)
MGKILDNGLLIRRTDAVGLHVYSHAVRVFGRPSASATRRAHQPGRAHVFVARAAPARQRERAGCPEVCAAARSLTATGEICSRGVVSSSTR